MKRKAYRAAGVLLLALALAAGCRQQSRIQNYQSFVFGTLVELRLATRDQALADRISSQLFSEFDRLHRAWHAWQPGELTTTNEQLATGE